LTNPRGKVRSIWTFAFLLLFVLILPRHSYENL